MARINEQVEYKYFLDALHFFYEMQWLYNPSVTELLTKRSLDAIPKEWLYALQVLENQEINMLVAKKNIKPELPDSLKSFIEKCKQLDRLPLTNNPCPINLPQSFKKGLTCKKQHEISHVADLVHKQCAPQGIKIIIDLGAGLGYVCQLLYHLYGYKVLGLERNQANLHTARVRQEKMYPDSMTHVKYNYCDLTSDSVQTIENMLQNEFHEDTGVCLLGLHACGDLSVHALKIFNNLKAAQIFIMISCCYHKLSLCNSIKTDTSIDKQYFHNFPLSHSLRAAIDTCNFDIGSYLRQTFLRLSCQEPADRWDNMSINDHNKHSFYVLARAVLQLYVEENHYSLQKCVRKGTRKTQCTSFETYVQDSLLRYTFKSKTENEIEAEDVSDSFEMHKRNITELWEQHCDKLKRTEIYSGLQLMLQAPAESFVLQDRLCWIREQGLNADIIPVMNKCLSPRSYAIVSHKRINLTKD